MIRFALALLLATPATAAEITLKTPANGQDVITIRGMIERADDKKFIEVAALSKAPNVSVVLNSIGGYIGAAGVIGRIIYTNKYETRVHNGTVCNSACPLIWFAGVFRHLDLNARLGLHTVSTETPPYERDEAGNARVAKYLIRVGVPQNVINLQAKADPCCMNYISYEQAKAWGLLNAR